MADRRGTRLAAVQGVRRALGRRRTHTTGSEHAPSDAAPGGGGRWRQASGRCPRHGALHPRPPLLARTCPRLTREHVASFTHTAWMRAGCATLSWATSAGMGRNLRAAVSTHERARRLRGNFTVDHEHQIALTRLRDRDLEAATAQFGDEWRVFASRGHGSVKLPSTRNKYEKCSEGRATGVPAGRTFTRLPLPPVRDFIAVTVIARDQRVVAFQRRATRADARPSPRTSEAVSHRWATVQPQTG
jgi:hypothetical protein